MGSFLLGPKGLSVKLELTPEMTGTSCRRGYAQVRINHLGGKVFKVEKGWLDLAEMAREGH